MPFGRKSQGYSRRRGASRTAWRTRSRDRAPDRRCRAIARYPYVSAQLHPMRESTILNLTTGNTSTKGAMGHESFDREDAKVGSTDRSFGLVFSAVFLLLGAWPWVFGGQIRVWSLIAAAAFFATAMVRPALLAPLNRLWTQFGLLLHRIVSPVVLGIMFFAVITPMGLVRRMLHADPLHLRFDRQAPSYWVERTPPGPAPDSLTNQF